jgi:hypothetical protein
MSQKINWGIISDGQIKLYHTRYKKQILVSEKNCNQISNNKNINLSEAPEEVEIISDTIAEFVKTLGDNCLKIVPQKNQQDYVLITVKIINFNHIFRKSI